MATPYSKMGDPAVYLRTVKRAEKLIADLARSAQGAQERAASRAKIRRVIDDLYEQERFLPEARAADGLGPRLQEAMDKSAENFARQGEAEIAQIEERERDRRIAARERGDFSYQRELELGRRGNPARFPEPEAPLHTFRNDEEGMESYVVRNTRASGGFNVTLRDLDSGEMIPWAQIGVPSIDEAIAFAQEIVRFPLAKSVGSVTAENAHLFAARNKRAGNPAFGPMTPNAMDDRELSLITGNDETPIGIEAARGFRADLVAAGYGDTHPSEIPGHVWRRLLRKAWDREQAEDELELARRDNPARPKKAPAATDAWSVLGLKRPKPIAEDKLAALLPKLRKGADSSLNAAQVIAVAEALGWTVEPAVYVAVDEDPYKEPFYTHHPAAAEEHRAALLARALPGAPDMLAPGERAVWNVQEIESWPMKDSPTGRSYRVQSDQAEGVIGLRFTDTRGKVIDFVPDRHARRPGKAVTTLPGYTLLSGGSGRANLREASSWFEDINRRLGTEAHVARPRTREGTATCWFCWRNIKMTPDQVLVHHGYQRPGTGEIHGDCLGVHRQPYELAVAPGKDALAGHQRAAENYREAAMRYRSGEVLDMRRRSPLRGGEDVVVPSGAPGWGEAREGNVIHVGQARWAEMLDNEARRLESRAESEQAQADLYEHAVATWRPRPLPTEKDFEGEHLLRLMKEARDAGGKG